MARGVEGLADTKFPFWFEFGIHSNGNIDIHCRNGDVATNIEPEKAEHLMIKYNEAQQMIIALGQALADIDYAKFREIWGDL